MLRTLELVADAQGKVSLPADLKAAPGSKVVVVVEAAAPDPALAKPGWGRDMVLWVADDFDEPLSDEFWLGAAEPPA
jgi:hypothetical protein